MPELRREQFEGLAGRLAKPDGGFSVRVPTGKEPKTGYMVSQAGTEKRHGAAETISGEHLEEYAGTHHTELHKASRHFGGWHDPKTHEKDLDISRRFTSHDRARAAMWAGDQDALYDLNRGHSEHNFAKHGTAGTTVGRYLHEGPMPDDEYGELKRAAARRSR